MPAAPDPADYVGINPNARRYVYFAGGGGGYLNKTLYNESPLELETNDTHQLNFKFESILHHTSIKPGDHIVVIDEPKRYPAVVYLEYQVIAENHPDKQEDTLKVIIHQEEA